MIVIPAVLLPLDRREFISKLAPPSVEWNIFYPLESDSFRDQRHTAGAANPGGAGTWAMAPAPGGPGSLARCLTFEEAAAKLGAQTVRVVMHDGRLTRQSRPRLPTVDSAVRALSCDFMTRVVTRNGVTRRWQSA